MTESIIDSADGPMALAIQAMTQGFDRHAGFKPFGAVVAKDGVVIAKGLNTCIRDRDPTAHAEVNAIRAAALHLNTPDLSGCVLYASAQPCPMCRAAAFHAGMTTIFYASTWADYQDLFPDQACHEALSQTPDPAAQLSTQHHADTIKLWNQYRQNNQQDQGESLHS